MKYPEIYEERLLSWRQLRCSDLEEDDFLLAVNDFWSFAPTVRRGIDWDSYPNWPDPWQLLVQNQHCELAKALGIAYTILLSERQGLIERTELRRYTDNALSELHLCTVDDGKYVLSYAPRQIVNINLQQLSYNRSIRIADLSKNIR